MSWLNSQQVQPTRKELIEKRLDEILTQWMTADESKRGMLLRERIRLKHELEELELVRK